MHTYKRVGLVVSADGGARLTTASASLEIAGGSAEKGTRYCTRLVGGWKPQALSLLLLFLGQR